MRGPGPASRSPRGGPPSHPTGSKPAGTGETPESEANEPGHRRLRPFFATRPKGTGLGLAIRREIPPNRRGEITVASEPGSRIEVIARPPAAGDPIRAEGKG